MVDAALAGSPSLLDQVAPPPRISALGHVELWLHVHADDALQELYEAAGLSRRERLVVGLHERGVQLVDIGWLLDTNGDSAERTLRRAHAKLAAVA